MLLLIFRVGLILLLSILTCGCGTYIPSMAEFWEGKDSSVFLTAGGLMEYKVKQKVYCAIVDAVSKQELLPNDWAVQVTLDLQVDETGALNPGVSFIKPLPSSQSFTLGLGGTLSSQATHEDKFGSYWELARLVSFKGSPCNDNDAAPLHGSSPLIEEDLGIKEWLTDALKIEYFLPSSGLTNKADPAFKQDALSYHAKFIIISSGSVTPTWKLLRIATGNGSLPLGSANRTRTHDLLITFGPAFKPNAPNIALASHAAQEFGIAVANGTRTVLSPLISP